MKIMGRPKLYHTDEQRAEAILAYKAKFRTISIDAELIAALNSVADKMEGEFGFRPTLSQTIRCLIVKGTK